MCEPFTQKKQIDVEFKLYLVFTGRFYHKSDKESWKFVAMNHFLDLLISTPDKMTITGQGIVNIGILRYYLYCNIQSDPKYNFKN